MNARVHAGARTVRTDCTRDTAHALLLMPARSMTERRRRLPFWDRVKRGAPEECWPWIGFTKPSGHGLTTYKSMPIHASRKAWILTHGPITSELCVNHRCDNAACCNPYHMYLGTRSDNMIDRWSNAAPEDRQLRGRPT